MTLDPQRMPRQGQDGIGKEDPAGSGACRLNIKPPCSIRALLGTGLTVPANGLICVTSHKLGGDASC